MNLWIKILGFWIIFFLGFLIGVGGLENINFKVFDEVYFIDQAYKYLEKEEYFDAHPPLAKMLFAGLFYLFGKDNYFPVRIFWLIISSFLGCLVYLWVFQKTQDFKWSFLAGFLVNIETSLLFFRKFLLLEVPWLLFSIFALWLLSRENYFGFFLMTGLAIGTKWFSLPFILFLALPEIKKFTYRQIFLGLVLVIGIYFLIFEIHYFLLKGEFKIYLSQFLTDNLTMLVSHHLYNSVSYSLSTFVLGWPFGLRPIPYLKIYMFPNILIFWASFITIIFASIKFKKMPSFITQLLFGYWSFMVLLLGIEILRPGWIYYYLGALVMAIIILAYFLKNLPYALIPLSLMSGFLLPSLSYHQFWPFEKIIFEKLWLILVQAEFFIRNIGIWLGFKWF